MVAAPIATTWPALTATTGHRLAWSWRELLLALVRDLSVPHSDRNFGWSPALFAGDRRGGEHVEAVTALCLDYDSGEQDLDAVCAAWGEWRGLVHSSKGHTPEAPRLRVVLPLASPTDAAGHARLAAWAIERQPMLDRHARDASRFWWWPSTTSGVACHRWLRGRLLRVSDAPEPPPRPPPRPIEPGTVTDRYAAGALRRAVDNVISASIGDRHGTLCREAYSLARLVVAGGLTEGDVTDALIDAALAAGKPEGEAVRAVRDGLRAGSRRATG